MASSRQSVSAAISVAILLAGCSSGPDDPGVLRPDDVPGSSGKTSPVELADGGTCSGLVGKTVRLQSADGNEYREFSLASGGTLGSAVLGTPQLPKEYDSPHEALEPMRDAMRECSMRQDMGGRPFEILSDLPGESFGYRSDETYGEDSPVLTRVFAPAGERIVVLTLVHAADEEPPVDVPTLMSLAVERASAAQD